MYRYQPTEGLHSALQRSCIISDLKDKDQLWSSDCIVQETLWNRSEKVDHTSIYYWCVLQGSGIIKMIRNLAHLIQLQALYTKRCIWDYPHTCATRALYLIGPNRYNNLPNISISRWFLSKICMITYQSKHILSHDW